MPLDEPDFWVRARAVASKRQASGEKFTHLDRTHETDERDPMPTFKYEWFHTSTGMKGTKDAQFDSRAQFLAALCEWNRLATLNGTPEWHYSEVP